MSQITLRGLPEPLEREIRKQARRRGSSLNKLIISILEKGLGVQSAHGKKRDFSSLAGTWDAAAFSEFTKAQGAFETIDAENWQP
jgi:hypothetical protein